MATQIRTALRGSLSGTTQGGQVASVPFTYTLDDQDSHDQVVVTVEDGDVLKDVCLPDHPQELASKQTLFLALATGELEVRLNGIDALTFALREDGPLVIGGLPLIYKVECTSKQTAECKLIVNRIFGINTMTDPSGGITGGQIIDKFVATAGQTAFTLTRAPLTAAPVLVFAEGVMFSDDFFTLVGAALTWNGPVLPLGARFEVLYS